MTFGEFVTHDGADRRHIRGLGAGQPRDNIHAGDGDLQQSALHMPDKGVNEAHQADADAAALHHEAREDEEGHREQDKVAGAVDHRLRQHHQRRGSGAPEIGRGREQQHEADGDAGEDRKEEQAERGDDRGVVAEQGQPGIASEGCDGDEHGKDEADAKRHRAMIAPEIDRGIEHEQRHAGRQRRGNQRRRQLEDRRQLIPARGQEFDGDKTGDPGDEQHDDIGKRKAAAFAAIREPAQDDPDEGVIAPPVGDRAADERQDRQREPRDLVGPQEGVVEKQPRHHVGKHQQKFAEQRRHDQAFGGAIDQAKPFQFRLCRQGGAAGKGDLLFHRHRHDLHRAVAHRVATCAKVEIPRTPFMQLPPDGAAFCFLGPRPLFSVGSIRRRTPD